MRGKYLKTHSSKVNFSKFGAWKGGSFAFRFSVKTTLLKLSYFKFVIVLLFFGRVKVKSICLHPLKSILSKSARLEFTNN